MVSRYRVQSISYVIGRLCFFVSFVVFFCTWVGVQVYVILLRRFEQRLLQQDVGYIVFSVKKYFCVGFIVIRFFYQDVGFVRFYYYCFVMGEGIELYSVDFENLFFSFQSFIRCVVVFTVFVLLLLIVFWQTQVGVRLFKFFGFSCREYSCRVYLCRFLYRRVFRFFGISIRSMIVRVRYQRVFSFMRSFWRFSKGLFRCAFRDLFGFFIIDCCFLSVLENRQSWFFCIVFLVYYFYLRCGEKLRMCFRCFFLFFGVQFFFVC